MPLKLPSDPKKAETTRPVPKATTEELQVGDTIEYGITMEVSPQRGSKAWIKMGATSSVREGESTEQARQRVCGWVETKLDARLDELA